MRLVLLGMPGAGKGTHGERIAKKYGIPHISTGNIIRQILAEGVGLSRGIGVYVNRGDLIPDELVIQMVYERFAQDDCQQGWILDGFPRTVAQAMAFDQRLQGNGLGVQMVFDIRITPAEAVVRLTRRRICEKCGAIYHVEYQRTRVKGICDICDGQLDSREDDTIETAHKRFAVYMRQTHPVIHYYAQHGLLYSVDGLRSIEAVSADLDQYLSVFKVKQRIGEAQ